ncbi:MAG: hypothetical protein IJ264_07665, partial [Clostridia bacterium]|nr:hypothetical protein [Clostridia bacterium]
GGSTAGVVTVVKNAAPESETTTVVTEAVTTAPEFLTEYVFNKITLPETTAEKLSYTKKETRRKHTKVSTKRASTREHTTAPESTSEYVTRKETTAKNNTTTKSKTTRKKTTTRKATTSRTETTTQKETTTKKITTTTEPSTTVMAVTTAPTTTEPTTQAPATLIIEVTDFDNNVVATITEKVDAGTEITSEYLVSLVSAKGYEAMAGVYGEAIGSIAEAGQSYTFTAEL